FAESCMITARGEGGARGVTVTATSTADPSQRAVAAVTVTASTPRPTPLSIVTAALPSATAGVSYAATLAANGGTPPYRWSVTGALPPGIQLDPTGTLSGTSTSVGQFKFTAQVADSGSTSATASLSLSVAQQPPTNSTGFDGPAELPRVYIQSSVASTPSPGSVTFVTAGSNLQLALNAAKCGDTLML